MFSNESMFDFDGLISPSVLCDYFNANNGACNNVGCSNNKCTNNSCSNNNCNNIGCINS
jgi:hypothetical protein